MRVCGIIYLIFLELIFAQSNDIKKETKDDKSTAVAPENDDRLLLFATLDGSLVNIDRITGDIKWDVKDGPIVEAPLNNEDASIPIFLPDPRDGSLYLLDNSREPLKKLPFTIPQLVASSPCRSSDGILYTGKKKDAWFKLDPSTGLKQQIIGWDTSSPTCPIETPLFVYVGRTKYNIAMVDSNNPNRKWNVTFFDYTSKPVGKDDMANFELVLFASSSTGKIIALDRRSGQFLWELELESPVIGIYLLDSDGLLNVPYTMLANHTISYLSTEFSADHIFDQKSRMKLYPTVYIGLHKSGLYAIPSLVDQNVVTITASDAGKLLLSGPNGPEESIPYPDIPIPGQNYHLPPEMFDGNSFTFQSIPGLSNHISIFTGHYNVPKFGKMRFMLPGRTESIKLLSDGRESKEKKSNKQFVKLETDFSNDVIMDDDEDDEYCNATKTGNKRWSLIKYVLYYAEEMTGFQRTLFTLLGMFGVSTVYIVLIVRYVMSQKVNSQSSNGIVQVGKIAVNLEECIGSGSEGTMVYKGEFDGRSVAVKRFVTKGSKQIELIEREVALLKESDDHPNVIRYFCTEKDIGFRYIALEMCQGSLFDYIENSKGSLPITHLQILQQTTEGLAHLHHLGIVHRDLKPQNVLISMKDTVGNVKAMISDFGLCKKLQTGKNSFSASSLEGSEGYIAPEVLKEELQSISTTVDIFSLGCLFYYVLSDGLHPFGEGIHRTTNIINGEPVDLQSLKGNKWEVNTRLPLIQCMISKIPSERPNCVAILSHPVFWDFTKILNFLQEVSDRIENVSSNDDHLILKDLELNGKYIVLNDWGDHLDEDVIEDLRIHRSYHGRSVRELLRAMRNKKNHFWQLTERARNILGDIPDGFTFYWVERFPLLLIHTYLAIQCISKESIFTKYYQGGHIYSLEDFRLYSKTYCESNKIYINEELTDFDQRTIPKSQKRTVLNKEAPKRSYKNAGPLKSKSKKPAHKNDEPKAWILPK